jgi:hypothetical protein
MIYYHGSPVGDLIELKPNVSNHKEAFVYFSSNRIVAMFYTVWNNWYPYGFSKIDKSPIYFEYYPNGFMDIYSGKSG